MSQAYNNTAYSPLFSSLQADQQFQGQAQARGPMQGPGQGSGQGQGQFPGQGQAQGQPFRGQARGPAQGPGQQFRGPAQGPGQFARSQALGQGQAPFQAQGPVTEVPTLSALSPQATGVDLTGPGPGFPPGGFPPGPGLPRGPGAGPGGSPGPDFPSVGDVSQPGMPPDLGAADLGAPGPEEAGDSTMMQIIGVVLLLCVVALIGYLLYRWFQGRREYHQGLDDTENKQIDEAAYARGKSEAEAKCEADKPKVSQYGAQFPAGTSDCDDDHPSCPEWAKNDECFINPGYMLYKCKKSCQTCGLTENTRDQIRESNLNRCQNWGEDCENANCNDWYQALRCRKTCLSGGCNLRMQ